ncbi:MAG TPA: hypothetical protein VL133_10115, partial [Devosia sp.]|nr:hypothetical protein [Devosia sp.]
ALQDCFAAADGAWVAVSVAPAMVGAAMALLAPVAPTALPEAMRHWMASQKSASAVAQLLQAGIPAAVARNGLDLWADRPWSHGIALGAGDMVMKGQPFRIGDAVPAIERDAPQIGADTVDVLARIAGYSRAEIDVFHRAGVIEIDGGTTAVGN